MESKVAILILAAGAASRMGKPKQLLPYRGTHLLGHAIQTAIEAKFGRVYCILGAHQEEISAAITDTGIKIIVNTNWQTGLSSSIIAGLDTVRQEDPQTTAVLIMLADQPKVKTDYLRTLASIHFEEPQKILATDYGKRNGVPALFPSKYFKDLLVLKGDAGARELLNANPGIVRSVKPDFSLIDIDTQGDYEKLIGGDRLET